MKKWISLVTVSLLILVVAAVLSGCGGDTDQAKEYMQKGDELLQKLQTDANAWQSELSSSMANITEQSKFQAEAEKAKSGASELGDTAEKAKAEYEKILSLEGVDDYKEYAKIEIEALDAFQELVEKTNAFLDEMVSLSASGDVTAITSITTEYSKEAQELGNKISELDEEAQKLKSEKNL
jgi:uncharacterized membrane protein YdfJ with MMPL/SSD domain